MSVKICWKELRQQKLDLLRVQDNLEKVRGRDHQYVQSLMGLANLIDAIQDEAVTTGEATEEQVFGPPCPYCGDYLQGEPCESLGAHPGCCEAEMN